VLNGRAIATTQKKLKAIPPQLQDIQAAQVGTIYISVFTASMTLIIRKFTVLNLKG
jgi:hypothetical protein